MLAAVASSEGTCVHLLCAVLVGPQAPRLGDGVLAVELRVVRSEAVVLVYALARGGAGEVVADIVEHIVRQSVYFFAVAGDLDQLIDRSPQRLGLGILQRLRRDHVAVVEEVVGALCRVPVQALETVDATVDGACEIPIVGDVGEPEDVLELADVLGALLADEDLVDDIGDGTGVLDASGGAVHSGGLEVLVVVPDGLRHARRRYRAVIRIGVQFPEKRDEGTRIRATVRDPRRSLGAQVDVLETSEFDIVGEVGAVGKGLVGGQEAEALRAQVLCWDARAVVSVL